MHTKVLHLLCICLFGLCLALPRAASCMDGKKATARLDSLELKDGRLVLRQTGKPLPDGVATLSPVEHSDMRFAVVEAFAVERDKLPVRPGLYLVRSDGVVTYFNFPLEDAGPEAWENVVAVSLSPDKDTLALGYFVSLQGLWYFFHWPDVRLLEHPTTVGYWETSASRRRCCGAASGRWLSIPWTWKDASGRATMIPVDGSRSWPTTWTRAKPARFFKARIFATIVCGP